MTEKIAYNDQVVTDRRQLAVRSEETTSAEMAGLDIVERLKATLEKGWIADHALAAIQIGVPVRVAVYKKATPIPGKWDYTVLVNPVITKLEDLRAKGREGCLSLPGQWYGTYRYRKITVENGPPENRKTLELEDLDAWVAQHEIDHMDGRLCDSRTKVQDRNEPCECGSGKKFKRCHGA